MGTQKNIIQDIHSFIEKEQLIQKGSTVLLGLSGGPDSVFLLHVLVEYQKNISFTLIAAHLDHQWRDDSAKDAQFCQQLCESIGVQLYTQKISKIGFSRKFDGSRESHARHARRYFFKSIVEKIRERETNGAQLSVKITLAHHAQDQQETFFIRLLRGTSLSGLTSMKVQEDNYIRPLLKTNKQDILEYLDKNNISYLTDQTNSSDEFLRNRIRNHVIPALQKADSRFDNNFALTLRRLQNTEAFLQRLTAQTFETIFEQKKGTPGIKLNKLFKLDPVMQYRVLLYWLCQEQVAFVPTESFFNEIIRFLKQPGSKAHQIHKGWAINKQKQHAEIVLTF